MEDDEMTVLFCLFNRCFWWLVRWIFRLQSQHPFTFGGAAPVAPTVGGQAPGAFNFMAGSSAEVSGRTFYSFTQMIL